MVRLSQALFDVMFVLYSFIIMCYIINLNDRTRQPGFFLFLPLTLKIKISSQHFTACLLMLSPKFFTVCKLSTRVESLTTLSTNNGQTVWTNWSLSQPPPVLVVVIVGGVVRRLTKNSDSHQQSNFPPIPKVSTMKQLNRGTFSFTLLSSQRK